MTTYSEPEGTIVSVTGPIDFDPSSTVVIFEGLDENGLYVVFAADHRPARNIIAALADDEDVIVDLPDWAILDLRTTAALRDRI